MTATAPSLFGNAAASNAAPSGVRLAGSPRQARDLMDLLYDGFYMVFLLRNFHGVASWFVDSRIPLAGTRFPFARPAHARRSAERNARLAA